MQSDKSGNPLRKVALEDLLGREPAELGQDRIRECIEGKVVMVTGAAGSIGSELCRQIAGFHPRALVGLDQAETPLFYLQRELEKKFPALVFHPEIGSITRRDDVNYAFERRKPSIVYHAAAYKHVPMLENQIFAAIENNIFGTWQVASAAALYGAEYFVLISTDKAVRPSSVMGATKRVAEIAIRSLQKEEGTKYVAVRFGNVLGSSGSVVPIFKEQIAAGGPVTVTHPEMKRYFMTASEASQLVLQAFVLGIGGEVFVLDMGAPVNILELAGNLIRLSGLQPELDIKVEFTGVRAGEKLFEELNREDEQLAPTPHSRINSLLSPREMNESQITAFLHELQNASAARDSLGALQLLKGAVPEYNPACQHTLEAMPNHAHHGNLSRDLAYRKLVEGSAPESAASQMDEPAACAAVADV